MMYLMEDLPVINLETEDDILWVNLDEDEFEEERAEEIFDEEEYSEGCFFCGDNEHYSLYHLEAIGG